MLKNFLGLLVELLYLKLFEGPIKLIFKDNRSFSFCNRMGEGKLAIVEDPELKRRVIAMVDYYSQFLLKPIHKDILNLLKNFPSDRTFNQNPFNHWGPTMGHRF